MHRPVPPAPVATFDADAGEMPVPEFLEAEGGPP